MQGASVNSWDHSNWPMFYTLIEVLNVLFLVVVISSVSFILSFITCEIKQKFLHLSSGAAWVINLLVIRASHYHMYFKVGSFNPCAAGGANLVIWLIENDAKKAKKWQKPWQMGTHLRVLSEGYLMNTNKAGFERFSDISAFLCLWWP